MKIKFLELARKMSFKSGHHTHKLGCVIVKGNQVLGFGINKVKTHPRSLHPFQMTHAELDAVLDSERRSLIGADVYVYRETKDGKPANSKPCKSCEVLLKTVGVHRVFYSCQKGFDLLKLVT